MPQGHAIHVHISMKYALAMEKAFGNPLEK